MKFHNILFKNATLLLFSIPISLLFAELAIATDSSSQEINSANKKSPIAQASIIQVTKVQINPSAAKLEIVLETQDGRSLQIDTSKFRIEGSNLIADIPSTVLALPERQEFKADNPTREISNISVTQLDANTIRVNVRGNGKPPTQEVTLKTQEKIYSLNRDEEPDEEITVTGTRTARPVRLTPSSIAVIDAEKLDRTLSQDLRDVFRYEPNVSVGNNRRYGLQDINIRGLGGNRVLILNDGIRVPTQFSFGTPSLGRDYVDLESLQRVEVIRGPASALYGSDALGGVVSFRTIEPGDLLKKIPEQSVVTSLSTNVETVDRSFTNTAAIAFRDGNFEGLLGYTRRDGAEARVPTGNEFVDSRSNGRNNWIGKLVYRIDQTSKIGIAAEIFRNRDNFIVAPITAAGLQSPTGFIGQNETLENNTSRDRFSISYDFNDPNSTGFLNAAKAQLYYQNSEVNELRTQDFVRTGAGVDRRRLRNLTNSFLDRVFGGEVQLQSRFKIDEIPNQLTYGIDISNTRNERVRNGVENRFNAAGTNILTTNVVGADNFPVKDFPDSNTFRLGIYAQNEIAFSDTFTLIPGIRFDSYQLNTAIDELYLRNSPDVTAANFSDSAISPSLGFVWQTAPEWTLLGRYAKGFRTPLYSEINSGFTNLTSPGFRYKTLSNPNLRPETSDTFEIGIRTAYPQFNASLTGFYNLYNNFIQSNASAGTATISGIPNVSLFQTQNVARASTYGFELSGEYKFSPDNDGFSLIAALGLTVGDNLTTNQPLETIDPIKAVLGLRYRAPENLWGADLSTTFAGQPRLASDRPANSYTPQGYTVVDLTGFYKITPRLTLNLGVFNLLNNQYFLYSDVRPLITAPAPSDLARYAQPGISLRAGLTFVF
ncbi:MAG: TonB-dependent receptor [Pseudanabaena frigida]|uniref:TonB-dependent receptor n=1 Tax=Pseudanabaena frigida TaxID=945775 RepID=A0A2W4W6D4_9CYAN|nr:MAG: TonB-dependent receptor [Pseudanabaena frigida]